MSKNVTMKKPYCKVCQDAGKPEREYTSHWVKDLTGKTICPTLLSTECRYCFKLGHTAKFCDILAKKNKEKEVTERRQSGGARMTTQKPVVQKVSSNLFTALCDDSDTEEVSNINDSPKQINTEMKNNWASIAAKPKETIPVAENTGIILLTKSNKYVKKPIEEPVKKPVVDAKPAPWATNQETNIKKSWADWSDSEDENDDYMYKEVDDTW